MDFTFHITSCTHLWPLMKNDSEVAFIYLTKTRKLANFILSKSFSRSKISQNCPISRFFNEYFWQFIFDKFCMTNYVWQIFGEFLMNFFDELFERSFLTNSFYQSFWWIFWRIFLSNFFDKLLTIFLEKFCPILIFQNFFWPLNIASFRVGVPSILFLANCQVLVRLILYRWLNLCTRFDVEHEIQI